MVIATVNPPEPGQIPRAGYLFGGTLSNNVGDATNDIDITATIAASDDTSYRIMSAIAMTKRTDANWVAGTGNGALDTGAVGNNTYHWFIIYAPSTGATDYLCSLSATAPTMPATYTLKRRIGSVVRTGGAIKPFFQNGDVFQWVTSAGDIAATADDAGSLKTLTVPTGIMVAPLLTGELTVVGVGNNYAAVTDARDTGLLNPQYIVLTLAGTIDTIFSPTFFTNTSAQIFFAFEEATDATIGIGTLGWIDTRGRPGS